MNQIFKYVFTTIISFTIIGCSHSPRTVQAEVPLIEELTLIEGQLIPNQYWATLNTPENSMLSHERFNIQLEPLYTSGLGNRCRKLLIETKLLTNKKTIQRIACERKTNKKNKLDHSIASLPWVLTRDIIIQSISIKL
ncbi:hypothetical protein [Photobacterium leiognathi]|uniref:hypothetical protein n=1 Tax=Photobacterium leiognathi TaxID=553611 RepID=UPI002980E8B1|nr:hypothetical protein [Photobacterium leiognathi]